jgi:protein-disulfide isomerase
VEALSRDRPVRRAIRHLPLADVHALALPAAEALEAAATQGRFFETLDILVQAGFSNDAELLARLAQSVPDPERLRDDVKAGRFRSTIVEHIRQATASGVHGVPEVFIDDKRYGGALTRDSLGAALEGREWRPGSRGPKFEN